MRFYLKKFFSVSILLGFAFVGWNFSYEANTWFTDFSFGGDSKISAFYVSGGELKQIQFYLTNRSDFTISGNFDVVDAVDMGGGLYACKANGQDDVFGKYGVFQQTGFLLGSNETISGSVSLVFPEGYSGEYLGCITYTPFGNEESGSINSEPRKALLLKAILNATATLYQVKVYPGSRSKPTLANKGEIRFYQGSGLIYSDDNIISDASGNAEFSALIPDGIYTVVYKGQSHLASYLYDMPVIAGTTYMFDFTTGSNLLGVQNFTNTTDNGSKYQIAGDLKNIEGKYDFTVNGNDIAIITVSGFVAEVPELDPRDLNGDKVVNVSDLAIIGANFEQQDIFFEGHLYNGLR